MSRPENTHQRAERLPSPFSGKGRAAKGFVSVMDGLSDSFVRREGRRRNRKASRRFQMSDSPDA